MFAHHEAAIIEHFQDVLPGRPVFGTFDEPDFEQYPIFVQVQWLGYDIADQHAGRRVVLVNLDYVVRIAADTTRIDDTQAAELDTGLRAIVQRALSFSFGDRDCDHTARPILVSPPPPQWQGAAGETAVYLKLQNIEIAGDL